MSNFYSTEYNTPLLMSQILGNLIRTYESRLKANLLLTHNGALSPKRYLWCMVIVKRDYCTINWEECIVLKKTSIPPLWRKVAVNSPIHQSSNSGIWVCRASFGG